MNNVAQKSVLRTTAVIGLTAALVFSPSCVSNKPAPETIRKTTSQSDKTYFTTLTELSGELDKARAQTYGSEKKELCMERLMKTSTRPRSKNGVDDYDGIYNLMELFEPNARATWKPKDVLMEAYLYKDEATLKAAAMIASRRMGGTDEGLGVVQTANGYLRMLGKEKAALGCSTAEGA